MQRRRLAAVTAGLMLTGLSLTAAQSATAAPVAGCGAGHDLRTVRQTIAVVDWRIYTTAEREQYEDEFATVVDANGDGYLCVKQFRPSRGSDKHWGAEGYVVTGISDNRAQGRA